MIDEQSILMRPGGQRDALNELHCTGMHLPHPQLTPGYGDPGDFADGTIFAKET